MLQKKISPAEFVYCRTSGRVNLPAVLLLFLILLCTSGFFFVEACFGARFSVCFSSKQQTVPTLVPSVKLMGITFYWYLTCTF